METLHLEAHVEAGGRLILELPADFHEIDIDIEIKKQPLWKSLSEEEYRRRLRELIGSIDDPTFVEPEDCPLDPIEPWD